MAVIDESWSDGAWLEVDARDASEREQPIREGRTVPQLFAWYVVSRAVAFLGMGLISVRYGVGFNHLLREWDASWYLYIAAHGYPPHPIPMNHWLIQGGRGSQMWAVAFLPGFPLAIATLGMLGIPPEAAGIAVSLGCGFVATLGIYRLGAICLGPSIGKRAAILFCLFPGALVFSWIYTEGLSLGLSVTCLCCLLQRRWVCAGVLAALAGAVHVDIAIALTVGCVLAASQAVWQRREWWALAAPACSPMGVLAYLLYLQLRTGSWENWRRSEQVGWHQRLDFGSHEIHALFADVHTPLAVSTLVDTTGALMAVVLVIALFLRRLPAPAALTALTVLILSFASSDVGLRPRAVLAAAPAFVSFAGLLSERATRLIAFGFMATTPIFVAAYLGAPQLIP